MAKILVVDDEQYVRDLLTDIPLEAGHDVLEGADGVEAIDKACVASTESRQIETIGTGHYF